MKLITKAGIYETDTFWQMIIEVLRHRFWHLKTERKWKD